MYLGDGHIRWMALNAQIVGDNENLEKCWLSVKHANQALRATKVGTGQSARLW